MKGREGRRREGGGGKGGGKEVEGREGEEGRTHTRWASTQTSTMDIQTWTSDTHDAIKRLPPKGFTQLT